MKPDRAPTTDEVRLATRPAHGMKVGEFDAWLARHARRPLDPTPPGPPVDGEQTELELEIR